MCALLEEVGYADEAVWELRVEQIARVDGHLKELMYRRGSQDDCVAQRRCADCFCSQEATRD